MVAFSFIRGGYLIGDVQTIDETRRQRLAMLIKQHGSIAALNELLGLARTDATLSQIRNKSVHSKTRTPRAMGDPMARKIELALGLASGWMDTPPSHAEMHGEEDPRSQAIALAERMSPDLLRRMMDATPETAKLIELALLSQTDLEQTKLSPSLKGLIGFVKQQIREETKGESTPPQ